MRRAYGVAAASGMALGLVVGVGPLVGPAAACSCVGFTDAQALDRSRAAFTGELVGRREAAPGGPAPDAPTTLVFAVSQVLKGQVSPRQEVVTSGSSASCGLELRGPGPYLLFAEPAAGPAPPGGAAPGPGQLAASLCGGSRLLQDGEEAELVAVVRGSVPIDPLTPAAAPPAGPVRPADETKGVDGPVVLLSVATLGGLLGFAMIVRRERRTRRRRAGQASPRRRPRPPREAGPPPGVQG